MKKFIVAVTAVVAFILAVIYAVKKFGGIKYRKGYYDGAVDGMIRTDKNGIKRFMTKHTELRKEDEGA